MTLSADLVPMRRIALLCLVCMPLLADEPGRDRARLPADVAAQHPEKKWTVRKADLYRYLVRYYGMGPGASGVLDEYMKRRLIEAEAKKRRVTVTEKDVDKWLKDLDGKIKAQGGTGLDDLRRQHNMKESELRRKGREWLLTEGVARAVFAEKDPTRKPDAPISDDSVTVVANTLYEKANIERTGLPDGVVARINGMDVTEYEYGRELSHTLTLGSLSNALRDLIVVEEVKLLLGDKPAAREDLDAQKEWYLEMQRNELRRLANAPERISEEMVDRVLKARGLSLEQVYANPVFHAQARARGHFRRRLEDAAVGTFWEENKGRYGAKLVVQRILVGARAQQVPGVGKRVRTLQQGKAESEAIWLRASGGEDFSRLARQHSEDPDAIRENGGRVPFPVTAQTPGYEDTFAMAEGLELGGISKPWFSQGRGYVIVKLLAKEPAPEFDAIKSKVRTDMAERDYIYWLSEISRAAHWNADLRDE